MSGLAHFIIAATSSDELAAKTITVWFDLRLADWAAFLIAVYICGALVRGIWRNSKPGKLFYESRKARIYYSILLTPCFAVLLVAIVVLGRVALFGK